MKHEIMLHCVYMKQWPGVLRPHCWVVARRRCAGVLWTLQWVPAHRLC